MAKIKSLTGKCSNNCKDGFTIFTDKKEASQLVVKFPFLKIIKSDFGIVGKAKKEFQVMKCNHLKEDGGCDGRPENAPAWCKLKS